MIQKSGSKIAGAVGVKQAYPGLIMNQGEVNPGYPGVEAGPFQYMDEVSPDDLNPASISDKTISHGVDKILYSAIQHQASDIHIEPREKEIVIRFRRDGLLYPVASLSLYFQSHLISRLKLMSGMDITEKRIPQDGRFAMTIQKQQVDFRVSTLPALYGEKVVIRILDPRQAFRSLSQLGLSAHNYQTLTTLCRRGNGLILVTGPTGSGKTTTLYALIHEIKDTTRNIIALEDPVEYSISGVNQVQIRPRAGLTFAAGLRAILRQDPDIIMVGEIRDVETADLAIHAAMTGHLVLSTLHTNSAVGTITRLAHMRIEPYLLADSLVGIVSQRLVRVLCNRCCQPRLLDEQTTRRWGAAGENAEKFLEARGCSECWETGYRGRVAIQEVLIVSQALRDALNDGKISEAVLNRIASESGMVALQEDGLQKARNGVTTLEEVFHAIAQAG